MCVCVCVCVCVCLCVRVVHHYKTINYKTYFGQINSRTFTLIV